jgi:hypothetical protein
LKPIEPNMAKAAASIKGGAGLVPAHIFPLGLITDPKT